MPSQNVLKIITIALAIVLAGLILSTLLKKPTPPITAPDPASSATSLPLLNPPPAAPPALETGEKSAPAIAAPISPAPVTRPAPLNPPRAAPPVVETGEKSAPEIAAPISPAPAARPAPVNPPPAAPSSAEIEKKSNSEIIASTSPLRSIPTRNAGPRPSAPAPSSIDIPAGAFAVYSRGNRLTEGIKFSEMDEKFGLNSPGDITWEFTPPPAKLPEGVTLKWFLDRKLRGYPMPLTSNMLQGMQTYPDMPEPGVWEIRLGRPGEKDLLLFTFTILKEEKGAQP
jgi:hypothetical protein